MVDFFGIMNKLMPDHGTQAIMQTLEKNMVDRVRSEMDNLISTVESRVHDAILIAIDNSVTPRVELVIRSANSSSVRQLVLLYSTQTKEIFLEVWRKTHI